MERIKGTLNYLICLKGEIIEKIITLDKSFLENSKKGIVPDKQNEYITFNILVKYIDYLIDYILEIDISNFDENEIIKEIKEELKKYEECFNINFNELLNGKYNHLFESDVDFFRKEMELS